MVPTMNQHKEVKLKPPTPSKTSVPQVPLIPVQPTSQVPRIHVPSSPPRSQSLPAALNESPTTTHTPKEATKTFQQPAQLD